MCKRLIGVLAVAAVVLSGCGGIYEPKSHDINSACNNHGGIAKSIRHAETHESTVIYYELICKDGTAKVVLDE
jgi:hypothetical protein